MTIAPEITRFVRKSAAFSRNFSTALPRRECAKQLQRGIALSPVWAAEVGEAGGHGFVDEGADMAGNGGVLQE